MSPLTPSGPCKCKQFVLVWLSQDLPLLSVFLLFNVTDANYVPKLQRSSVLTCFLFPALSSSCHVSRRGYSFKFVALGEM